MQLSRVTILAILCGLLSLAASSPVLEPAKRKMPEYKDSKQEPLRGFLQFFAHDPLKPGASDMALVSYTLNSKPGQPIPASPGPSDYGGGEFRDLNNKQCLDLDAVIPGYKTSEQIYVRSIYWMCCNFYKGKKCGVNYSERVLYGSYGLLDMSPVLAYFSVVHDGPVKVKPGSAQCQLCPDYER